MTNAIPLRSRPGYKWLICITATLISFCVIGLTVSSFSIYLPYIQQVNGFSSTQTNMLLTYRTITQLIGILLVGRYYRRFSFRVGAAIALVGLGFGFLLYGLSQSYFMYCLSAVTCGFCYGLGSTVGSMIINEWFDENKASALGICAAGSGIAAIVVPVVVTALIESISLRYAFFAEGTFVFAVAVLAFLVVCRSPSASAAASSSDGSQSLKTRRSNFAINRKHVCLLTVGAFLMGFGVLGVTGALAQLLRQCYSATHTSLMVTGFGIALFVGKIAYGRLTDSVGLYKSNFVVYCCMFAGTLGIFFAYRFMVPNIIFIILIGFGCPLSTVTIPLLASQCCAPGCYINALKQLNFSMNLSGLLVSYAIGFLADLTNSHAPIFLLIAVLTVVSAVLIQVTCKVSRIQSK